MRILSSLIFILLSIFICAKAQPGITPYAYYEIIGDSVWYKSGIRQDKRLEYPKLLLFADTKTFEPIPDSIQWKDQQVYAKDKNYVYYQGEIINDASPKTFKLLCSNKLGIHIYADSIYIFKDGKSQKKIDRKTFQQVGNFFKDKNFVYTRFLDIILNIHPDSFEVVGGPYYKDHLNVYFGIYYLYKVKGADLQTFNYLFYLDHPFSDNHYARDKNHVYFGDKIIDKADPSTIKRVEGTRYLKDKNSVFYEGSIIEGIHPNNISSLKDHTEKD